jgi:ribose transport system permease protein
MTIGMGVLTLATQSTLYQGQSSAFASFGTARFGVIPAGFLLLILAMVIAHIALKYTSFGYHVKYTGSSPRFAQVSGIPAVRTVILCFVIVAACAWAAGVLLAGFSNTGVASVGTGYEFDALAAVVIGGNSLFGGRASIARTALGLLLVSLISNVLLLVGMSFDAQTVTKGLVIIAAVVIDALANRRNSKVIS